MSSTCPICGEATHWNNYFKFFICSNCGFCYHIKPINSDIIEYNHHGIDVKVQEHLKGRHREHCLCHQNCKNFKPDSLANCKIAQDNFENCKKYGIVLPVWECPKYEEGETK